MVLVVGRRKENGKFVGGVFSSGFTIVELLIVIVVIAILAAVSIVAYNGIQARTYDSSVKNDLTTIAKKIELYRIDNGSYPSDLSAALTSADLYRIKIGQSAYQADSVQFYNLVYCTKSSNTMYALAAVPKSGKKLSISSEAGQQEYTGIDAWTSNGATVLNTICGDILSGATYSGARGYQYNVSPQWNTWTGV